MMARLNVRLPILRIDREAPFYSVPLGLREADTFRVPVVQDFEVSQSGTETVQLGDLRFDHPVIRSDIVSI